MTLRPGDTIFYLRIVRAHRLFIRPYYAKVFGDHKLWIGRICISIRWRPEA